MLPPSCSLTICYWVFQLFSNGPPSCVQAQCLIETSHLKGFFLQVYCGATGKPMMWWWKINSPIAPHILYKGVLLMSTAALFLSAKAGKARCRGSKTSPEIQDILFHTSVSFRYRHFALGHVGNIHVMTTGLNQKRRMEFSLPVSWRYTSRGKPTPIAGVPLFHVGSNQQSTNHSSAF